MSYSALDENRSSLTITLDWEKAAWIVLLVVAILSRFYDIGARVISHDESLHTQYSWQLYNGQGFEHTPLMHGPFQFHALAASYFLFGASDATSRVPAAVFGVASVGLLWCFRRWIGRKGALAAAVLMVISPCLLYYSRYVRNESFVVVWVLLMALAMFRYFEERNATWLYLMAAAMAFLTATKEVSFIYQAIWLSFLGLIFVRDLLQMQWAQDRSRNIFRLLLVVGLVALVVTGAFYGLLGEVAKSYMGGEVKVQDISIPPGEVPGNASLLANRNGIVSTCVGIAALIAAVIVANYALRRKMWQLASFDLLVIIGTLVLPQLVAFPVRILLQSDPLDYSVAGMWRTGPVLVVLVLISSLVGLAWNWRKWLIGAGMFYGIYVFLFTTMFTNGGGLASGIVGSLGYWLDQQAVQRGSQPWYYYMVVPIPIYEYLPAIGLLVAVWCRIRDRASRQFGPAPVLRVAGTQEPRPLVINSKFPVLRFLGYWTVTSLVAYTLAGEKMPWLTVHMVLPMVMLAGWGFGKMIERIDWDGIRTAGGLAALVMIPICGVALIPILWALGGSNRPFQGNELTELRATMGFLSAVMVFAGTVTGLYFVGRRLGAGSVGAVAGVVCVGVLVLLTIRTSTYANYINFDNQTEFINYASGAPGVKVVMEQVEEISQRTEDGLAIRVAYDNDVSWPFTWYLRDYSNEVYFGDQPTREAFRDTPLVIVGDSNWARVEPLLGDNYYSFEYIRMWWPMQEYYNLSGERIRNALVDPGYREAIWNIWFRRDFTRYGHLTGVDYSLANWPVVDRMRLYIRKDLGVQLWNLGLGPMVLNESEEPDQFETLWKKQAADLVWGAEGGGRGEMQQPRSIAIGPDGFVYVADTFNHRIQKFNAEGGVIKVWGGFGTVVDGDSSVGLLNEPWGIAVSEDGYVYVADTWNHRVQKYNSEGGFVATWGHFGNDMELGSMWGPRAVAIGPEGNVYVADTGNKRVSVFGAGGEPLRQIGASGVMEGELDEPVGVAVSSSGEVYVADTWNHRVEVFGSDGAYLRHWAIPGWFGQSLDNKPYLGLDDVPRVYVSDPEGYRVFVTDRFGEPLFAWGDYGSDNASFGMPSGVALDSDGKVYVVDASNHRVMRFDVWEWLGQ